MTILFERSERNADFRLEWEKQWNNHGLVSFCTENNPRGFRGTSGINLKLFFKVMGNILIVMAAGPLGNAVHALIEAGALSPTVYVYNCENVISHTSVIGGVLLALVGYSNHLSVIQFAVWFAYLAIALVLFNRSRMKEQQASVKPA